MYIDFGSEVGAGGVWVTREVCVTFPQLLGDVGDPDRRIW